ncbi:hypothetical protein QFZ35_003002 [Arthrobacter ulcerisalmonis]|nr:hypothetical protein [Arthrobacter ulcerisalmonis]MDQ0664504.1 hypothetical protein [Arthrobacter ulcerisalmonis]
MVLFVKAQVQIRQVPAYVFHGPLVFTQPLRGGRGQLQGGGVDGVVSGQEREGQCRDGLKRDGFASAVADGRDGLDGCGTGGGAEDNFCFQSGFLVTLEHGEDVPVAIRCDCVPDVSKPLANGGFSVALAGSGPALLNGEDFHQGRTGRQRCRRGFGRMQVGDTDRAFAVGTKHQLQGVV